MSGEISGMAVSSIGDAGSRATPDDTRRLHYQLRAPRDWPDTRWGESMPCCSPATFVSNLPTVVSIRGDQAARAEIELWVADLGYFRREQIREQNELDEGLRAAMRIRNLPLSCYFTVWAAGGSNPAPRIKSRTGVSHQYGA